MRDRIGVDPDRREDEETLGRSWGRGNCDQNRLHKKIYFQKSIKSITKPKSKMKQKSGLERRPSYSEHWPLLPRTWA